MAAVIVSTAFFTVVYIHRCHGLPQSLESFHLWTPEKKQEHFCHQERECISSDEKVCGYDENVHFLATFGDVCTMYRANCKGVGMFTRIDMIVCETKENYHKEHPKDTFDFVPVPTRATVLTDPHENNTKTSVGYIFRIPRVKLTQ